MEWEGEAEGSGAIKAEEELACGTSGSLLTLKEEALKLAELIPPKLVGTANVGRADWLYPPAAARLNEGLEELVKNLWG